MFKASKSKTSRFTISLRLLMSFLMFCEVARSSSSIFFALRPSSELSEVHEDPGFPLHLGLHRLLQLGQCRNFSTASPTSSLFSLYGVKSSIGLFERPWIAFADISGPSKKSEDIIPGYGGPSLLRVTSHLV